MTKRVFITTDVFVAFLDRNDLKHLQAAAYFRYFAQEHFYLYTSDEIVIELFQKISQSISQAFAKEFIKTLLESSIHILTPDESEVKKAISTLANSYSYLGLEETLIQLMAERHYIPYIATFSYIHSLFGREIFYLPL